MIKKRVAILMACIYTLMTCITLQPIQALEKGEARESIQITGDRVTTTGGQIEVTTKPAVEVGLLELMIEESEYLLNEAVVATTPGAYTVESKIDFKRAIEDAKKAIGIVDTVEEVEKQCYVLRQAMMTFKCARNIDIGQLGLAVYYYGMRLEEDMWEKALWFDINCDGQIDIMDLTCIANKLIENSYIKKI